MSTTDTITDSERETLITMTASFARYFGRPAARRRWLQRLTELQQGRSPDMVTKLERGRGLAA